MGHLLLDFFFMLSSVSLNENKTVSLNSKKKKNRVEFRYLVTRSKLLPNVSTNIITKHIEKREEEREKNNVMMC